MSAIEPAALDNVVEMVRRLARRPKSIPQPGDERTKRHVLEIREQLRKNYLSTGARRSKRQVQAGDKKKASSKRQKTVPRCSSPSHFLVNSSEESKFGKDHELGLPDRERVDHLLRNVGSAYYHRRALDSLSKAPLVPHDYGTNVYTTADAVRSAIRRPLAWDTWSPKEIALFEAGITKLGKDFQQIQRQYLTTKSTSEIVQFYYTTWKHTSHYNLWKQKPPSEKPPQKSPFDWTFSTDNRTTPAAPSAARPSPPSSQTYDLSSSFGGPEFPTST